MEEGLEEMQSWLSSLGVTVEKNIVFARQKFKWEEINDE